MFVGYQTGSRSYRLYNSQSEKIIISRDVIIHEKNNASSVESETEVSIPIAFQINQARQLHENDPENLPDEDRYENDYKSTVKKDDRDRRDKNVNGN